MDEQKIDKQKINKQKIIIIAVALVILSLSTGIIFGKIILAPYSGLVKEQILAEIDQKVEEKAKMGILPLIIMPEGVVQERHHLFGEVVSQNMEANRFGIKLLNHFEGGSFTEFLFQPAYLIKEIILMPEIEVTKSVISLGLAIPENKMIMEDPMLFMPEEKQLSIAEFQEIIAVSLEAKEPLHLGIETKELFILGQAESLSARSIHFTAHQ